MTDSNYRHVLKGRNNNNNIHLWTGNVEVYSNYSLMNPDQVFDGFPSRGNYSPGTGDYPSDYFMSYIYRGGHHIAPLNGPGLGARADTYRSDMMTYKGLASAKAFGATYGHAVRDTDYSLYDHFEYNGVTSTQVMTAVGHAVRATSTMNSFGSFGPYVNKGVTVPMEDLGQALPTDYDNEYGRNKVQEWRGVASARAL